MTNKVKNIQYRLRKVVQYTIGEHKARELPIRARKVKLIKHTASFLSFTCFLFSARLPSLFLRESPIVRG